MIGVGNPKDAIRAKMEASRAEIRRVLEPAAHPDEAVAGATLGTGASVFPRSRTLRLLLSGRGLGAVGAVVGGMLIARPALAIRLISLLRAGAVGRMLLAKALSALRGLGTHERE